MEHESQPIDPLDRLAAIRTIKKEGERTHEWRKALCDFFDESPNERLSLFDMQELELLYTVGHIDDNTFRRCMSNQTEQLIESLTRMEEI